MKPDEVMSKVGGFPGSAGSAESEQTASRAISSLLEDFISAEKLRRRDRGAAIAGTGSYADIGADELARIFTVARHLKALSLQSAGLSPLRVQPACWWVAARPLSDRLALARQAGHGKLHSVDIDADHFDIVRADSLLLAIESALAAMSIVSAEETVG
jgi:hypothetical protein